MYKPFFDALLEGGSVTQIDIQRKQALEEETKALEFDYALAKILERILNRRSESDPVRIATVEYIERLAKIEAAK